MTDPAYEVVSSTLRFTGRVIAVRTDDVRMPDGTVAARDVIEHPGAVGVVAMDADDRILLIRQYRPAVRCYLWELPAGLLDAPGEDPRDAAARELAEEVGITADDWAVLVDVHSSPGMTNEIYRVYLARQLSDKTADFVADPTKKQTCKRSGCRSRMRSRASSPVTSPTAWPLPASSAPAHGGHRPPRCVRRMLRGRRSPDSNLYQPG